MCGNRKDSSKIALNVDLHLALHRPQHDRVHHQAQYARRLDPLLLLFVAGIATFNAPLLSASGGAFPPSPHHLHFFREALPRCLPCQKVDQTQKARIGVATRCKGKLQFVDQQGFEELFALSS